MEKKNELEPDRWVYSLSLDITKPLSTAFHAVHEANKTNTTYTTYTRTNREIFPLQNASFW